MELDRQIIRLAEMKKTKVEKFKIKENLQIFCTKIPVNFRQQSLTEPPTLNFVSMLPMILHQQDFILFFLLFFFAEQNLKLFPLILIFFLVLGRKMKK